MSDAAPAAGARPGPATLLVVLALASGMAGLVHELLYLRLLSNALGELFQVHTVLVAVFLLAMGIGAAVAHRMLRWLFALELALGLHALAFPGILAAFQASALDHLVEAPALHAVLASLLLLAWPAACIGLSVPCFAVYLAPRLGGAAFSRSYLAFNLGAAASLLAVEYGLIRWLGYSGSLLAVGAVNVGVGAALWLGRRRLLPPEPEPAPRGRLEPRLLAAVFLASAWSGVFSATFFKVAYELYHPQRENFALCTAGLLLALSAGTWLVERRGWSFTRCVSLAALALAAGWPLLPFVAASLKAYPDVVRLYGATAGGVLLRSAAGVVAVKLGFILLIAGPVYAITWGERRSLCATRPAGSCSAKAIALKESPYPVRNRATWGKTRRSPPASIGRSGPHRSWA